MTDPIPFAGCFGEPRDSPLVFIGLDDDSQSTYLTGCAEGPTAIRSAYDGQGFNATTETGVDVEAQVRDFGDIGLETSWGASSSRYHTLIRDLLEDGKVPFSAGGDHAVTIPVVEAFAALGRAIHVVQVDAHPDLYDDFDGNRFSHACTGARILEMEHVSSLTQYGIRTLNAAQIRVAERHADRLTIHHAKETPGALPRPAALGPGADVYVTIDMDGFDPAFAPGVSHAVPGGLTSRQVLDLVSGAEWNLVGMDVVEVNPSRDRHGQTAILAARLLHEGMGVALERSSC